MNTEPRDIRHTPQDSQQILESLLAAARLYSAQNWPVIPLLGKRPAVSSWKTYQSRLPTSGELDVWWSQRLNPTGIGIVTGRCSGLIVVDCDTADAADYWLQRFPTSPYIVHTGRGGIHLYYENSKEDAVGNRAKVFGQAIDIRAEGGYVAAPPSIHPNGTRYCWDTDLANMSMGLPCFESSWLISSHANTVPLGLQLPASQIRNAVAYIGRIRAMSGQGGHNATFRATCKLRDAGLSPQEAIAVLTEWNETNADPPWSASELQHKIDSVYRPGPEDSRNASKY